MDNKETVVLSSMVIFNFGIWLRHMKTENRVIIMTYQTLSLEKYWKLFSATLSFLEWPPLRKPALDDLGIRMKFDYESEMN